MAQSESVLAVRVKEALGMKVIFRADDLGMSEGINYGIAKAISCGPIKSVGLMPNMPAASRLRPRCCKRCECGATYKHLSW